MPSWLALVAVRRAQVWARGQRPEALREAALELEAPDVQLGAGNVSTTLRNAAGEER